MRNRAQRIAAMLMIPFSLCSAGSRCSCSSPAPCSARRRPGLCSPVVMSFVLAFFTPGCEEPHRAQPIR